MADGEINQKTRIELKKLAGLDSLNATQINEILVKSAQWITNFYSEAAGDKKVKGDFAIEGFSYGGEFDLSTAADILSGVAPPRGRVPYLFLSDLVNFVEQIRTSLSSNKISLNSTQRQELDKLGSTFTLVGVNPASNKVSVEDLQRIEYIDYSRRIVQRIRTIHDLLKPSLGLEETEVKEETEEEKSSGTIGGGGISLAGLLSSKKKDQQNQDQQDLGDDLRRDNKEPDSQFADKKQIKISELDSQSKLYLQSLSIITINQALGKYFNAESLAKLGLPPGSQVTFDQLPLDVRRQLMDRSFLQVEGLLLSGEFSLDSLIKDQSQRIIFSSQAALGLLMDVHGLKLLNDAVRDIAKYGDKKIKTNEKEKLKDKELSKRVKNEKENVLDTKKAQETLDKESKDPNFARVIESKLNIIGDEKRLEDVLVEELRKIVGDKDNVKLKLAADNIRPLIEVFIQQGLPPEFLIPDPNNFDYNRFINIFGKSLDQADFNAHKLELAHLIIFYWKRKRAIWSREIREEFALEKYTPEEAVRLLAEIKKNPKRIAELRNLGVINYTFGGSTVAEELAGTAEETLDSIEAEQFKAQQKELIEKFLEEKVAKLNKEEQQKTLKVYFEFYMPGVEFTEYNIEIFQTQIAPQINPMDFYMLQAGETFGPGAFDQNGEGYVQRAFDPRNYPGEYHGTDFLDSAVGKKGKQLASKALSEGLYYALDAAGGWGEALRAAEVAAPILKQLKEQLIEMGLEEVLKWIKKYWPLLLAGLALAALTSMLPLLLLLAPAAFLLRNGFGGLNGFLSGAQNAAGKIGEGLGIGGGGKTSFAKEAAGRGGQGAAVHTSAASKTLLGQFSSSAMATAGQAVIATVGATAILVGVYQTNLYSAFLTDFPFNDPDGVSNTVNKTSKYAEISKTAVIKTGCPSPENNGTKCEAPSFPVSIEYTVTVKPKEDYSLQITDIKDTIKFKQSQKGWEEAGQTPPVIDSERLLDFEYFKKIIAEQGGVSDTPLDTTTPSPIPETTGTEPPVEITGTADGVIVIPAGSSLTFTYTLDDLGPNYNHTAILNTIDVNFYYQNSFESGTDNVMTAARVCLGSCSAGAGCWPTTGELSQLPFGAGTPDKDASHRPPLSGGWADAYDIANPSHPTVFAPFAGNLCFVKCSDTGFGCYFILTFDNSGTSQKLLFAHFESPNSQLNQENSCMSVEEGFPIGIMGNRGNSTGPHLHYEVDFNGSFYSPTQRNFSTLETLVPETDQGTYPPALANHVTTCYE